MPWARIDDQFPNHPKVASLGSLMLPCIGLHTFAICYCNSYLTDGFIPAPQVARLAGDVTLLLPSGKPEELVDRLVNSGLWEKRRGGYFIHDFLEYNPSRDDVIQKREQISQRVSRFRERKQNERNAVGNTGRNDVGNGGVTPAPGPVPVPHIKKPIRQALPDGFEAFWDLYPRHVAKQAAVKAWKKLSPVKDLRVKILEALAVHVREDYAKREEDKIPHAATWLNGRRWEDELPAKSSGNGSDPYAKFPRIS